MTEFKVGDRVRSIGSYGGVPAGSEGVVTEFDSIESPPFFVSFDNVASPYHPFGWLLFADEVELVKAGA